MGLLLTPSTDMRSRVRSGLLDRGLAPHIADAFIMNFQDESGLNPGINEIEPLVPGSRGGFGLYQLTGPRRVAYEQYAQQRGVNPADVDAQLDFMMMELQGPESRAAKNILSAPDTGTAAAAIVTDFLRPAEEHRNRRVARYTGGGQSPQQQAPRGILSTMNTEPEAPMQQEKIGGLLGRLFPDMDADRADELRLSLNGMLHRPNEGRARAIQARMGGRAEGRERQQAAQQAQQQANRTAQWLAQQPGGQQYAQAIASGALPAGEALTMWRAASQGQEPVKGTEINGRLVNPVTGDVIADFSQDGGNDSAAEQEIARLMETGLSRDAAIRARDRYTVSRDPITGAAVLVDRATGETVGQAQQEAAPQTPQGERDLSFSIGAGDRTDAFGGEGLLKRGANTAADFLGLGVPFEDVARTQSDFGVLRESLINDIASAYPRQPPSWLLKNIEALTPTAGTGMGAGTAQSKLDAIKRNFQNELVIAQRQANRRVTPTQRQELEQRVLGLQAAIDRVDGALSAFGSQGQRKTSSGITFEVIE